MQQILAHRSTEMQKKKKGKEKKMWSDESPFMIFSVSGRVWRAQREQYGPECLTRGVRRFGYSRKWMDGWMDGFGCSYRLKRKSHCKSIQRCFEQSPLTMIKHFYSGQVGLLQEDDGQHQQGTRGHLSGLLSMKIWIYEWYEYVLAFKVTGQPK